LDGVRLGMLGVTPRTRIADGRAITRFRQAQVLGRQIIGVPY
jgi:hypothetical protein